MTRKRPSKLENLLGEIRKCIDGNRYTLTTHALVRKKERCISVAEVVHVLKTGHEEKRKTGFDVLNNTWKYAIRGKTKIDQSDVRVIVAFDDDEMLVITVMYIEDL